MISFPLTSKIIAGLGLALAFSLAANVWQLKRAWTDDGRREGAAERQTLQANLQAAQFTNAVNGALAKSAKQDHDQLVQDLGAIAERGRTDRWHIRTINAKHPLPVGCVPGADRMNAVNRALGPEQ